MKLAGTRSKNKIIISDNARTNFSNSYVRILTKLPLNNKFQLFLYSLKSSKLYIQFRLNYHLKLEAEYNILCCLLISSTDFGFIKSHNGERCN